MFISPVYCLHYPLAKNHNRNTLQRIVTQYQGNCLSIIRVLTVTELEICKLVWTKKVEVWKLCDRRFLNSMSHCHILQQFKHSLAGCGLFWKHPWWLENAWKFVKTNNKLNYKMLMIYKVSKVNKQEFDKIILKVKVD